MGNQGDPETLDTSLSAIKGSFAQSAGKKKLKRSFSRKRSFVAEEVINEDIGAGSVFGYMNKARRALISKLDDLSGQIQVTFDFGDRQMRYWYHIDDIENVRSWAFPV